MVLCSFSLPKTRSFKKFSWKNFGFKIWYNPLSFIDIINSWFFYKRDRAYFPESNDILYMVFLVSYKAVSVKTKYSLRLGSFWRFSTDYYFTLCWKNFRLQIMWKVSFTSKKRENKENFIFYWKFFSHFHKRKILSDKKNCFDMFFQRGGGLIEKWS